MVVGMVRMGKFEVVNVEEETNIKSAGVAGRSCRECHV